MTNKIEKQKITLNLSETLLAFVKNSVNSNTFRNVFFNVNEQTKDLTENGNLSCAVFVSSVLYLLKLIEGTHITVSSALKDMQGFGWTEIKEPKLGCVLVWDEKDFGTSGKHKHLGFFVGKGKAVSNNPQKGCPTEHNWEKYDGRDVIQILWHPKLQ